MAHLQGSIFIHDTTRQHLAAFNSGSHASSKISSTSSPTVLRSRRNKALQTWRCANGHEWSASLLSQKRRAACPKCYPANTSRAEQTLFHYVKQLFPSTQNRADVFYRGKHIELDIFIPEFQLAIEYDGPHHETRAHRDAEQNYMLNQLGIHLIRIRVSGLPEVSSPQVNILTHETSKPDSLAECIRAIGAYMKQHFPLTSAQTSSIDEWKSLHVCD